MKSSEHILLGLLRWATVCVFLGRGWLHLFWEAPYESIWWDESWMSGMAHAVGMSWHDWQTNGQAATVLLGIQRGLGICYLLIAVLTIFLHSRHLRLGKFLWLGSLFLILLSFASYHSHDYQWPQFWEHSAQFCTPIFFYLALFHPPVRRYQWVLRIVIAVTFTCHGLFALGWPSPTPANFLEMTMNILPVGEDLARQFLKLAGGLDLVVSVMIFLPTSGRNALLYAVFWGGITALARVLAYVYTEGFWMDLHRWLPEMVLRAPHALLPLAVWLLGADRSPPQDSNKLE